MSDMTATDWLRDNFKKALLLPDDAVEWLCKLFDVIQFFDDVVDKDPVSRERFDAALWDSLVGMNLNSFFIQNQYQLLPLMQVAIMKWQASDQIERKGQAGAKSYIWRASYYDIVMMVVTICHGHKDAAKMSMAVAELYGESFDDYLKEFENA